MSNKRAPRTLRPFVFTHDEARINTMGLGRMKGQCRVILDLLRSKPAGYEWTSRELCKLLDENPLFRSSTSTWRAANFWLWKFRYIGILEWTDERT